MIDTHCHILPGLDDGVPDVQAAVSMLKIAAADGIKSIIVTPHYEDGCRPTREDIEEGMGLLQPDAEALEMKLYSGMEVYLTPDTPGELKDGKLLTLAGSRYLLVELPFQQIPPYLDTVFFEIMLRGIIPVIAHPERQAGIISDPNRLLKYLERGVLTQVNTWSLLGHFGPEAASCAETLIKHGMAHFLGSDAHSSSRRTPLLKEAARKVKAVAGTEALEEILGNGEKLLANATVTSQHGPVKKKKGFFKSLLPKTGFFG